MIVPEQAGPLVANKMRLDMTRPWRERKSCRALLFACSPSREFKSSTTATTISSTSTTTTTTTTTTI